MQNDVFGRRRRFASDLLPISIDASANAQRRRVRSMKFWMPRRVCNLIANDFLSEDAGSYFIASELILYLRIFFVLEPFYTNPF